MMPTLAEQQRAQALGAYVNRILHALGAEDALVTDDSIVAHFLPRIWADATERRMTKWGLRRVVKSVLDKSSLRTVEEALGLPVCPSDRIVDLALLLKRKDNQPGA